MISLYKMLSITKQSHFKARNRIAQKEMNVQQVINHAIDVRQRHPAMGCRTIYELVGDQLPLGRDQFEAILLEHGFRVRYPRNYVKTTRSSKDRYYENKIRGLQIDGIDQLWQSDIAYILVNGKFCYLVFILDVYSRRIIGYQAHSHMLAQANIKALKQAFRIRGKDKFPGLIHHSDRGGQFIDHRYTALLQNAEITPSMSKECWENAFVERVNGTIKNQYLRKMDLKDLKMLRNKLNKTIHLYNSEKPHYSLPGKLSPIAFENELAKGNIKPEQITIYNPDISTITELSTKEKRSKKEKITIKSYN